LFFSLLLKLTGHDIGNESPALTLAQVEINIALIACSLVVMQPIVDKIYCSIPFLDVSTRSRWRIGSGRRQITDEQNSDDLIYGNRSNGAGTSHQIWSAARSRSAERKPGGLRSQGYGDDIIDDSDFYDEGHDTGGGGDSNGIEMDSNHTSKINVTTEIKMQNRNRSSLDD
jgi:hypothetical protein